MAQQIINIGPSANDGVGDPIRVSFQKINSNFTELYGSIGPSSIVSSFNTRTGAVTLQQNDLTSLGVALIASPTFSGTPSAPTQTPLDRSTKIATTAYVDAAVAAGGGGGGSGVSSFNTRTGVVTLATADITGAGGALANSPTLTGIPLAPTATDGTNTQQIATTAYVQTAIADISAGGVSSFNTRTGAVTLTLSDLTGTGLLNSPNMSGNPTAPTASPGDNTTSLATTAFVANAISGIAPGGVTTFNTRTGAITLTSSDVTTALTFTPANVASPTFTGTVTIPGGASITGYALLASPTFTGTPSLPTGTTAVTQTAGNNTTAIATTAFVTTAIAGISSGVISFNTRTGAVVLSSADVTTALTFTPANINSPTFTGTPVSTTPSFGDNSTNIATTAFVQGSIRTPVTVPLISSNVTLTAAQYNSSIIYFTGTLTASVVITFPTAGQWTLYNATTGAFTVSVQVTGPIGSAISIPQGSTMEVIAHSTAGILLASSVGLTASTGDSSTTIATTAYVKNNLASYLTTATAGTTYAPIASPTFTGTVTIPGGASISGYALLASPTFTGTPASVTPSTADNTTKIATTAYVQANLTSYLTTSSATSTYAPIASPTFTGVPLSTTPSTADNTTKIATTAYVQSNLTSYAPLASPTFTGTPSIPTGTTGVTQTAGNNSTKIATTAYVDSAVAGGTAGVASFNTRTGIVSLTSGDVTTALTFTPANIASPTFTGTPTMPTGTIAVTQTAGNSTTAIATTAFVATSFAPLASPTFTGAPLSTTPSTADNTTKIATTAYVQSNLSSYALLASPTFTGTPTLPTGTIATTQTAGNNTTAIATTAYVVASFATITNLALKAPIASPTFTGTAASVTPALSDSSTTIATTAYVQGLAQGFVSVALAGATQTVSALQAASPVIIFTGTLSQSIVVSFPTSGQWTVYNNTTGAFTVTAQITGAAGASIVITQGSTIEIVANVTAGIILAGSMSVTPSTADNTTKVATTAYVQSNLASYLTTLSAGTTYAPIASPTFTGTVTIPGGASISGFATLASPTFTGTPTLPTGTTGVKQSALDNSTKIATTSYVDSAVTAGAYTLPTASGAVLGGVKIGTGITITTGVIAADLTVVAALASPTFTGAPLSTTPSTADNTTKIATTAYVQSNLTSYAPLASPTFTGTPAIPTGTTGVTQTPGNNSTKIATTAYVDAAVAGGTAGVASFNTRTGIVSLTSGDVTTALTFTPANIASPTFTGVPAAPTPTLSDSSTTLATTAYVQGVTKTPVSVALAGATQTISALQAASPAIIFTGVLSQSIVVSFPTSGQWTVYNTTTGAFTVTVQITGGAGASIVIPQSATLEIVANSTAGIIQASSIGVTPSTADNTTKIATTAYVQSNLASYLTTASATSTYAPIASPTFTGTVTIPGGASITGYALLASPTFTGTPTLPTGTIATTQTAGNSTTAIATTAFVATSFAPLASPTFTGAPLSTTPSTADNTTKIATTAYVQSNLASYLTTSTAGTTYAPIASPTFTGAPLSTTPSTADNTTKIATTAYVQSNLASYLTTASATSTYAPLASPTFTGTPSLPTGTTAVTQTLSDSSTKIATTSFVQSLAQGSTSVALAGATQTVTALQAATPMIIFTGTLSQSIVVTMPSSGYWNVYNNTTGAFTVTLQITGGTGGSIVITQGATIEIISNATAGILLASSMSVTPSTADNTTKVATTAYVQSNLASYLTTASAGTTYAPIASPTFTGTVTIPGGASITGYALLASPTFTGAPLSTTPSTADNTTKIATTAYVQSNLSSYALLASPTFTGTPTLPTGTIATTQTAGNSTTAIATTSFVATSFAPLASPTFTGVPISTTPSTADNTTKIATTAYVQSNLTSYLTTSSATSTYAPIASPTFTGTAASVTPALSDSSTTIATTAYVQGVTKTAISVALSGTTQSITALQAASPIIIFTGTLTQSIVVSFPVSGQWILYNNTTGAFTVSIQVTGPVGSAFVVTQGSTIEVIANSTAGILLASSMSFTPGTSDNTTSIATTAYVKSNLTSYALLASPTFTGTPTLPTGTIAVTQTAGNSTTAIATTAFVATSFAPLASPTFTGTPSLPTGTTAVTQTAGNSTTAIATTAFVATSFAPLASPTFTGTPTLPTGTIATTQTAGNNTTAVSTTAYADTSSGAVSVAQALTNANVTLGASVYGAGRINFTGTLTGNVIITFPNTGFWIVQNNCTGAFTVTLSVSGGTVSYVLNQGVYIEIYSTTVGVFPASAPYDIAIYQPGALTSSQVIASIKFTRAVTFLSGAGLSLATAGTASTGTAVVAMAKNGSGIGSITYTASATGVVSFTSLTSFAAGDLLAITGPASADATLANMSITLSGMR